MYGLVYRRSWMWIC